MAEQKILQFSEGFLWGASTSAYQVEGGIINDWSKWEQENASRLAENAKIYWQLFQREKFPEMFDEENYICGQACNSFQFFEKDLECLEKISCNSYRLGIEWARIEPEKGRFDLNAVEYYRQILIRIKQKNIKIVLTLWHWTNPLWFAEENGWENRKAIKYFLEYAEIIIGGLGDLVDYWVTLNEPLMIIGHGYLDGKFPPNKKFSLSLFKVFNNFIFAHKECYELIHKRYSNAKVSIAMTTGAFTAANKFNPIERLMVLAANYFRNDWFLNRTINYLDYIGANYYHHDRLIWHPPFKKNLNKKITDRGWEIYPEGIYLVLKNYQKYNKPILILENGIADADDTQRTEFIRDHLFYIHQAISEGVDVRGYFYWSLLDNFEWAEGYWPKFGLFSVNRQTFERTARPSANFYGDICKNNRVMLD